MMSKAKTVAEYLASLPADRREALSAIREVMLKNLKGGYEEVMQYGMIGYVVPHSLYPDGYHCKPTDPLPFACVASQKNYISVYLMCVYGNAEHEGWFRKAWAATGKKLNMGKSCIRFKKLEDAALEVIGEAIARVPAPDYIRYYEGVIKNSGREKAQARKAAAKSVASKDKKSSSKNSRAVKKTAESKKITKVPAKKPTRKSAKKR